MKLFLIRLAKVLLNARVTTLIAQFAAAIP